MDDSNLVRFSVKQFIEVFNQTIFYSYPRLIIVGEITQLTISHQKWLYFSLKEDDSNVNLFGSVDVLDFPIEEGMMVEVLCYPRLHDRYGFKLNVISLNLIGEGTIKKSLDLLKDKLAKEGLFAVERKRVIKYPPQKIGLITSKNSAAYSDFIKIINQRFGGLEIIVKDVLVQGDQAIKVVIEAINYFNNLRSDLDALVIIRGGGSIQDLQAFSSESLTRIVATSRIPTLVAIGHEKDVSLSELAADLRASTPSNAAEILVPDKQEVLTQLQLIQQDLNQRLGAIFTRENHYLIYLKTNLLNQLNNIFNQETNQLKFYNNLLQTLDPGLPLKRGYVLVRFNHQYLTDFQAVKVNDILELESLDNLLKVEVKKNRIKHG